MLVENEALETPIPLIFIAEVQSLGFAPGDCFYKSFLLLTQGKRIGFFVKVQRFGAITKTRGATIMAMRCKDKCWKQRRFALKSP